MVHCKALPGQQDTKPSIPKPAALVCQFTQPLTQGLVTSVPLLILKDRPVQVSQLARPTFRHCWIIYCLNADRG